MASDTKKPFQVTNTKARLISIAGVDIPPGGTTGENRVPHIPEKHVDGVRASAVFRSRMLVEGKASVAMQPIDITKIGPSEAVKIVSVETDMATLAFWADVEKRSSVLTAISDRVKSL